MSHLIVFYTISRVRFSTSLCSVIATLLDHLVYFFLPPMAVGLDKLVGDAEGILTVEDGERLIHPFCLLGR